MNALTVIIIAFCLGPCFAQLSDDVMLADFRSKVGIAGGLTGQAGDVDAWEEVSDNDRVAGVSKAALVAQDTQELSRAVFFSVLNPVGDDTACFAGVNFYPAPPLDASGFAAVVFKGRARGDVAVVKVVLNDAAMVGGGSDFAATFQFDLSSPDLTEYVVPFSSFLHETHGNVDPDHDSIDLANVTQIGLQVFGGHSDDALAQSGATSFELDWIALRR